MTRPTISVKDFTVSYTMPVRDASGYGNTNHFVSQNFTLSSEVPPEQAVAYVLEASQHVTKAVVLAALARGNLTQSDAKELIESSKTRHEKMLEVIRKSAGAPPEGEEDR